MASCIKYPVYPTLLLLMLPQVVSSLVKSSCSLTSLKSPHYYHDGDFIIGGILTVHIKKRNNLFKFNYDPTMLSTSCNILNFRYYQNLFAFIFAVNEINKNPELLPNITLGFHIIDSCISEYLSINGMFDIMSGGEDLIPNYHCDNNGRNLIAFVDGISSRVTLTLARVFGMYKIPQISYSSSEPHLSDKFQFPSFYRTVPNDIFQYQGIVQLIKYFGWFWVGIFVSDNESGIKASQELQRELAEIGACVEFLEFIPYYDALGEIKKKQIVENLSTATANVFILHCAREYMFSLQAIFLTNAFPEKVWIISSQWDVSAGFDINLVNFFPFNGSLAFTVRSNNIPGFLDFILKINPDLFPDDIFIENAWWELFLCTRDDQNLYSDHCTGNETIQNSKEIYFYKDISAYSYSIYNAVYALTYALHNMHFDKMEKHNEKYYIEAWKLNKYLKDVHFTNTAGSDVHFDKSGDMIPEFDILNWIVHPNETLDDIKVGRFDQQGSIQSIIINSSEIRWRPFFNQTPQSVCSQTCLPGYRKSQKQGMSSCCYDCIPCPVGEISNTTDMATCITCPENKWPNAERDTCIYKVITYLSYEEPLGISLASASILFFLLTCLVLMIFIKHQNTPIVKANNRDLSYILLFSLKMCYLCNFIFIGQPHKVTCILRQPVFGVIFSISVSAILAKTLTVIIAFNATKPGSKLKKWMGHKVSNTIVIICSMIQVVICASWLKISPPFPYYNMKDEIDKIVAECNEGSLAGFYCVLGYMGVLAFISFIIAFIARKLPDIFNETKYITFSMLVFCSVWISFIPAYLSTKGKYVVAVEIFAILASSTGLLGCIFAPKCFIILLRPELNTKAIVTKKVDKK